MRTLCGSLGSDLTNTPDPAALAVDEIRELEIGEHLAREVYHAPFMEGLYYNVMKAQESRVVVFLRRKAHC